MSSIKFSDNKPIVITLVVVIIGMIGYFLISSDPEPVVTEQIAIPEVIAPTIVEAPEPEPEPEPEPPTMNILGGKYQLKTSHSNMIKNNILKYIIFKFNYI